MPDPTLSLADVPLICHPQTPCAAVRAIGVSLRFVAPRALHLRYTLDGAPDRLRVPAPDSPVAADRLWAHTCFEAFAGSCEGDAYTEWNFSPSGQHARHDFSGYRSRRDGAPADDGLAAPQLRVFAGAASLGLEAIVSVPPPLGQRLLVALTAVVEEADGRLSYWSVRHAPGKPDFHHRDAFALALDLTTGSLSARERTA